MEYLVVKKLTEKVARVQYWCSVLLMLLYFQLFQPLGRDEMIKVEEIEALSDKKRVMRARLSWLM